MATWPVRDARARFSEMLDKCISEGPQPVTRHGVTAAVLVSIKEWESFSARRPPDLKRWLLTEQGRGDLDVPPRRQGRERLGPGVWRGIA